MTSRSARLTDIRRMLNLLHTIGVVDESAYQRGTAFCDNLATVADTVEVPVETWVNDPAFFWGSHVAGVGTITDRPH